VLARGDDPPLRFPGGLPPGPRPPRTPGEARHPPGESFTPDNQFIAGEAPGLRNFFVGAGFNSVGIASAGGAGRALAERILTGDPGLDLTWAGIRRFAPFHGNTRFLHDRVGEVLGLHYAVPWPNRELATARPLRRSPVHHLVAAAGACFGSRMGWERPNVFAPAGTALASTGPVLDYSWGVPRWLAWSAAEQRAARRDVALFDQTSFSKYLLTGPDSERALAVAVHHGRGRAAGPDRVHRDAQRERPLRVRPHRDPPGAGNQTGTGAGRCSGAASSCSGTGWRSAS
jgi:FAD dependent oxidoreductase central domain/Aminomethyltransferase folate-binding domain